VTLPSSSVQNEFGRILDQARDHDIVVTRHDVPRAVLVSAQRYRELVGREAVVLETLQAQFDALYERMQTPDVRAGTVRGFRATPAEMGRAALNAERHAGEPRASSDQATASRKAGSRTGRRRAP
jgi:prevent-host-death family protein